MSFSQLSLRFVFAASVVGAWPARAQAPTPLPGSMAALGDSISAAAFGNFRRKEGIYPWAQAAFFGELFAYVLSGEKTSILERRYLSWSTGNDPYRRVASHARKLDYLRGKGDPKLKVGNFSVTGALTRDVRYDQLDRMSAWSEKQLGQFAPDYVTLLIGPNDLCFDGQADMTPPGQVKDDFSYVVEQLLSRSPRTRLMISAMPQVHKLRPILADETLTGGAVAKTCKDIWALTKECTRVLLETDPAKQARIGQYVQDYFWAMQQVVREQQALYGDRLRFSTAVNEVDFTPNDVSMDCFHPSPEGQEKLSKLTWESTWWKEGFRAVSANFASREADLRRKAEAQREEACRRDQAEGRGPSAACLQ